MFHYSQATSNLSNLWAYVFVASLQAAGLKDVVISPGSRSSALALAFELHPGIKTHVVLDERSAAFFALGLVKGTEQTVALLCTSGTAALEYSPAVAEAFASRLPLLVLTADRPPEYHYAQSEQTMLQEKLYGSFTVWHRTLPMPGLDFDLFCTLRDQSQYAYERTYWPQAGPVHLNLPFSDSLAPVPDLSDGFNEFKNKIKTNFIIKNLLTKPHPTSCDLEPFFQQWEGKRGLIIVGYPIGLIDTEAWNRGLQYLTRRLGWPVIADSISTLRGRLNDYPFLIAHYDLMLRNSQFLKTLEPEVIIHVGKIPTSKAVLREWLKGLSAEVFHIDPWGDFADSLFRGAQHLRIDLSTYSEYHCTQKPVSDWCIKWLNLEEKIKINLLNLVSGLQGSIGEPELPILLSQYLPNATLCVISTSMPIRDTEAFWMASDRQYKFYANRGVNGIDGLIATTLGIAEGSQKPTVLLIGDLSFWHDHASLLLIKNGFRGRLRVFCIDNGGGSIFRYLPIAKTQVPFDRLWITKQEGNIPLIAKAHGMAVHEVQTGAELKELLNEPMAEGGELIYIRVDSEKDFINRKKFIEKLIEDLA